MNKGRLMPIDSDSLAIASFIRQLKKYYVQTYGETEPQYDEITCWAAHLALENLTNTNALYHDLEHTILVSSAALAILQGKHLLDGGITPSDWMHFMVASLFHDIGFLRGICQGDDGDNVVADLQGNHANVPHTGTNAALMAYHVDRGQVFIRERFAKQLGNNNIIDVDRIAEYIEMTRFPIPNDEFHQQSHGYAALVRAADLIGQLGDPAYMKKIPALFYEFEEIGANARLNYQNPGDMREKYGAFFWKSIHPYIGDAIRYLQVTHEGRQWITNLNSHVFSAEHQRF